MDIICTIVYDLCCKPRYTEGIRHHDRACRKSESRKIVPCGRVRNNLVDSTRKRYALAARSSTGYLFLRATNVANLHLATSTKLRGQERARRTIALFVAAMGCFGMAAGRWRSVAWVGTCNPCATGYRWHDDGSSTSANKFFVR